MLQAKQELAGASEIFFANAGYGEKDSREGRQQVAMFRRGLELGDGARLISGNSAEMQQPANGSGHGSDNVTADSAGEVGIIEIWIHRCCDQVVASLV